MFQPTRTAIAFCLALAGMSVQASDYYVVTPVKGKTVNVSAIQVGLLSSVLTSAKVGFAYSYDFKPNLQVSGDATYTGYGVSWAVTAGSLPAGLTLNASTGVLSGTPTAPGTTNFTVSATYKTKTGGQGYQVAVANVYAIIALQASTDTDFGAVSLGNSVTKDFTVTNSGDGAATGVYAQVTGHGVSMLTNSCGTSGARQTIPAGGSCAITVQYSPTVAGLLTGAGLEVTVGDLVTTMYSTILTGSATTPYIQATGGTVSTPGDGYRYHRFTATGSSTFTITSNSGNASVDMLVVAGGGGGRAGVAGSTNSAGGGAGGVLEATSVLPVGSYAVTVGAGGNSSTNGTNSTLNLNSSTLTAIGGGTGGANGGSGGGGTGGGSSGAVSGGSGTAGQGYAGGASCGNINAGGGGGAGGVGVAGSCALVKGGNGGPGRYVAKFSAWGVGGYYGGGGAGADWCDGSPNAGGVGGGGNSAISAGTSGGYGVANTGGGGGGACETSNTPGGKGGTGVVIIRYPYN